MRQAISILTSVAFLLAGCASTTANQEPTRTPIPDPIIKTELPSEPEEVPESKRVVEPVQSCTADDGREVGPGIMMSPEMAAKAAKIRVAYDELRGLYKVDLRTFERERVIYRRELRNSDDHVELWKKRAERTFWEKHGDQIGLGVGIIIGVFSAAAGALGISKASN